MAHVSSESASLARMSKNTTASFVATKSAAVRACVFSGARHVMFLKIPVRKALPQKKKNAQINSQYPVK